MDEKMIARFWSKVDKHGPVPVHMPHLGQCWLWIGGKDRDGYGLFRHGSLSIDGYHMARAHRFSLSLLEPVPVGLLVLHACDNPSCVNPSHLSVGTSAQNSADMTSKMRQAAGDRQGFRVHPESRLHGAKNGRAKLSQSLADEIRHASGTHLDLADRFGVSRSQIQRVIYRKVWA